MSTKTLALVSEALFAGQGMALLSQPTLCF